MTILISILSFLIMIGLIVFIHEGGHYMGAKLSKIAIHEFSLGFGPVVYKGKINNGKTIFSIRLIPLGGFVKPVTIDTNTSHELGDEALFETTTTIRKSIMVAAGPISNFILAFVIIFFANTVIGSKELPAIVSEVNKSSVFYKSGLRDGDEISRINQQNVNYFSKAYSIINGSVVGGDDLVIETKNGKTIKVETRDIDLTKLKENISKITGIYFQGPISIPKIKNVSSNSVAEKAGILAGDEIIEINNYSGGDFNKYLRIIQESHNKEISMKLKRGDEILNLVMIPSIDKLRGETIGKIGIETEALNSSNYIVVKQDFTTALYDSVNSVISSTLTTFSSLKRMIFGEISTEAISGPISIATYSGKSVEKGIYNFLLLTAAISIGVGVFNLIPLPLLDGGHLAIYLFESITRYKLSLKQLSYLQTFGIIVLICLFAVAIFNDINKL